MLKEREKKRFILLLMVALWIYSTLHNIRSIVHSAHYSLFIVFLRLLLISAFVPETEQPVQSQLFSQRSKFKVRLAHIWPLAKTETLRGINLCILAARGFSVSYKWLRSTAGFHMSKTT